MIIEPPDKGWTIQVDEDIDSACGEDGVWGAPDISTDHFVLDSDTAAFAYGKHFVGRVRSLSFMYCLTTCNMYMYINTNEHAYIHMHIHVYMYTCTHICLCHTGT